MPLIAQICMVVVTIALVGIAVVAVRVMLQTKALIERASSSLVELPALIEEARRTSARADELLLAFSHITQTARTGVSQFEHLATRSSRLASNVLDEVEGPLTRVIGLVRGFSVGTRFFVDRWKSRAGRRPTTQPQGEDYVGEQRWLDDGGLPDGRSGRSRLGAAAGADGRR